MKKVTLIAATAALLSSGFAQAKPPGGNAADILCVKYKDVEVCYEWDAAMQGKLDPKLFEKGFIKKGLIDPKLIIPKHQLTPIFPNK